MSLVSFRRRSSRSMRRRQSTCSSRILSKRTSLRRSRSAVNTPSDESGSAGPGPAVTYAGAIRAAARCAEGARFFLLPSTRFGSRSPRASAEGTETETPRTPSSVAGTSGAMRSARPPKSSPFVRKRRSFVPPGPGPGPASASSFGSADRKRKGGGGARDARRATRSGDPGASGGSFTSSSSSSFSSARACLTSGAASAVAATARSASRARTPPSERRLCLSFLAIASALVSAVGARRSFFSPISVRTVAVVSRPDAPGCGYRCKSRYSTSCLDSRNSRSSDS